MASLLQGERGQKQAFIESVAIMIANEPSELLNKLEKLADYFWKNRLGLEDQPGDFTYRKAISTIMIEISKLVDAINSNQDSAVMNQNWRPGPGSLNYNDIETWVTALMRGKPNQPMTNIQQSLNEPK